MEDSYNSVCIEFPLRGKWKAPTSPVDRTPSHGTNRMGLRYAFDFFQTDNHCDDKFFKNSSAIRYLLLGIPLEDCYCWGEKIYAPCDGQIIFVRDGINERKVAHWLVDSILGIKNGLFFDEYKHDYSQIAGNYLVIRQKKNVYLLFAHLQKDSISVSVGDNIQKGEVIGKVGHSGNSSSPHLHFQVMDSSDIANAKGIPFVFESYDVFIDGGWEKVSNQIPSKYEQIRFLK